MSITPALRARVLKLEQRAGIHRDMLVIGLVIRGGTSHEQTLERLRLAAQRSPVVYIANFARLRGLERNP